MQGLLGLIRQTTPPTAGDGNPDMFFFLTAFADQGVDAASMAPWGARANEVGAKRMAPGRGVKLLEAPWKQGPFMARLGPDALQRLEKYLDFASLPANRNVIRQDESGNFMLVLLSGSIAVDREQPSGEHRHLSEAQPGDILGEMSPLDSGPRFSVCASVTDCEIAVLGAQAVAPHAGGQRRVQ